MAKRSTKKAKPRVVEGVGIAVNVQDNLERAKRIEKAMSDAVLKAMDEGITDPAEQRKRMMAAREEAAKA